VRPSALALVGLVKLLVGAYPRWIGCAPSDAQRIYFANHTSHFDTLAIWAALPPELRERTHPVAARDYWGSGVRRYVATKTLRAVLIDRTREERHADPLEPLVEALVRGGSLILFPEGTRGSSAVPAEFKGGLFHLAKRRPDVELVPVYLENLTRSLPKGALVPVPMTCTVRFGTPLRAAEAESKSEFLVRARNAVVALGPEAEAKSA
jgi:1-acyl-sn-glycerol-3-phosphate acyltransferase